MKKVYRIQTRNNLKIRTLSSNFLTLKRKLRLIFEVDIEVNIIKE